MEVLSCPPVCFVLFLQGGFDGVWREEVVAEKLYQLGRSGSGRSRSTSAWLYQWVWQGHHCVAPSHPGWTMSMFSANSQLFWWSQISESCIWQKMAMSYLCLTSKSPGQSNSQLPSPHLCFHFLTVCFFHLKQSIFSNQCFPSRRLNLIL